MNSLIRVISVCLCGIFVVMIVRIGVLIVMLSV